MTFTATRDMTQLADATLVELLSLFDEQIEKGRDEWVRGFIAERKDMVRNELLQRAMRRFVEQGDELTRLQVAEDLQIDGFINLEGAWGLKTPQSQAAWETLGATGLRIAQAERDLLELFIKTVKQEAGEQA